ncbi:MAG TPA: hypothetical protein VNO34_06290 [Actinomycetota bacterium]|nr:hypothetical protein [Actinomycetota bacterium]
MIAAAPQVLQNPCCEFINRLPWGFFLVVHIALFAVAVFLAYRSFEVGGQGLGWGFSLFALAEAMYATYHVNVTQFLFAHTVAEVLDGLAFVVLFAAAVGRAGVRGAERALGAA